MHLVVGVVAEGSTDVVVLDEYLSTWVQELDDSVTLEVRPLQPAIDATSGRFGDGGWTWVKAWCESNPSEVRTTDLFEPLFEGQPPVDVLLVQLDGDVIGDYAAAYADITVSQNPDAAARGILVNLILERWLWSSIERRHADPHAGRHCLVATVRALETWIVAGLDPSIPEPEEVGNPEQELMNLEPGLPTRRGRLRKNRGRWRRLAQKTRTHLAHIKSVCPHCEQFLSYFETAIDQPP